MKDIIINEQVSKITSFNGINVYSIKTDKFKTDSIHVFFIDNLSEENVTKNALVPAVLRRGCKSYPTFQNLAQYLEQLYGAVFDCGISKKGEQQIIQFYIEYVSERYTSENNSISNKALDLLYEVIYQPFLEEGVFKSAYVTQEKANLRKLIESRINNKIQYAVNRCFEELCVNEPFSLYEYGLVEQLDGITSEDLFRQYKYIIETLPMYVFISGNSNDTFIENIIDKLKRLPRKAIKSISTPIIKKPVEKVREVEQRMNVNQGKLSLGFRTNTAPDEQDYYALAVFNGILGGGTHSKLFQNVREKSSLAYYIFSRLEKFKGLMVISCGIEIENKDKTVKIIREQIEEILRGNISDYELESTLKLYETTTKSLADSHIGMVDFYLSQAMFGSNDSFSSFINKINSVKKEDVIRVGQKVDLGVIYFITTNQPTNQPTND